MSLKTINTDSLLIRPGIWTSFYPFFSQNFLLFSKVFRKEALRNNLLKERGQSNVDPKEFKGVIKASF